MKPKPMKQSCIIACLAVILLSVGCYGDKGNYDYREINEITIGPRGFENVDYKLRSGIDVLKIDPVVTATKDSELAGSYEYEWVAVGKVRNPGERTTLAATRELNYPVDLPSDDYKLLLRITDPTTGLVFSRQTEMSVSTAYTRGWLVATEDSAGNAVVDMVSISRDTLIQRDVVKRDTPHKGARRIWCDNNEYTSQLHGRIYLSTGEGCFLYNRESFSTDEYSIMRDYFANPEYLTDVSASDMIQIDDKFRVFVVDGYAYVYSISSVNTGYFGNPVNRYAESYRYVRIGDRLAYNLSGGSGAGSITSVMLYNDSDKCFVYLNRYSETLKNAVDTESDLAFYPWQTGLDYVTTVNSRFLAGQSATILHDPADDRYAIYTYTCTRSGPSKGARYPIDAAVPVTEVSNWCMTSQHGYMLYSVGSRLYGYDFRSGRSPVQLMDFSPADITVIHSDIHTVEECDRDYLYICTAVEGVSGSGRIRKYAMVDTADRIELTADPHTDWSGFEPIRSIWFKEM